MKPEEQRQVGEMFGRLLALDPAQLSGITQIDPAELQAMMAPQGAASTAGAGQPASPGQAIATGGAPGQPPAPQRPANEQPVPESGTYGVLQNLPSKGPGLLMHDSTTGASRPAEPGESPGPTEILMHGSDILQMGLRAHATVRLHTASKRTAERDQEDFLLKSQRSRPSKAQQQLLLEKRRGW